MVLPPTTFVITSLHALGAAIGGGGEEPLPLDVGEMDIAPTKTVKAIYYLHRGPKEVHRQIHTFKYNTANRQLVIESAVIKSEVLPEADGRRCSQSYSNTVVLARDPSTVDRWGGPERIKLVAGALANEIRKQFDAEIYRHAAEDPDNGTDFTAWEAVRQGAMTVIYPSTTLVSPSVSDPNLPPDGI